MSNFGQFESRRIDSGLHDLCSFRVLFSEQVIAATHIHNMSSQPTPPATNCSRAHSSIVVGCAASLSADSEHASFRRTMRGRVVLTHGGQRLRRRLSEQLSELHGEPPEFPKTPRKRNAGHGCLSGIRGKKLESCPCHAIATQILRRRHCHLRVERTIELPRRDVKVL